MTVLPVAAFTSTVAVLQSDCDVHRHETIVM